MHVRSFEFIDRPESEKIIIEKRLGKEVKHGIPYARRKMNYIFHHSKLIFLTTSITIFSKIEGSWILHLAKFKGNRPSSCEGKKL